MRASRRAQAFLDGAGPAAIGAILGAAVLLAAVLRLRRGVVLTLLAAAAVGLAVALAGGPLRS